MTAEHEVRAVIAERYAAALDAAVARGDEAGMLRAGDKLLELLDTLPVRSAEGGGAGGGSDGGRGHLVAVLDGPPQVGDAADA